MASVTKRGKRYWVRWREGGRGGINRSITVSTEREAQRRRLEIENALAEHGRWEPARVRRATPLALIHREYLADCVRRLQPSTVRYLATVLEVWRRWLADDDALVTRLSFETLSEWHQHLVVQGRHGRRRDPETVRKNVAVVERMWRWAWSRQARGTFDLVPQPDSLGLRAEPVPHQVAPSWAEMDAAIDAAIGWTRQLYVVLRCTGLRVQQAMRLTWADVDLTRGAGQLHIRGELGKSRQERRGRVVPITDVLVDELAGWGRREGWLVPCGRASRVANPDAAARTWRRAGVDPKVWDGSPHHAFRQGFSSGLKALGADTEAVEFLVGHSRGVREHYVGPGSLPLRAAVALVPALGQADSRKIELEGR